MSDFIEPDLKITRNKDGKYMDIHRHNGEWLGQITKHNGQFEFVMHKTVNDVYIRAHELHQLCNFIWDENMKEQMGNRYKV